MALTQVANLKGGDAKDRNEPEFIEQVVANIHRRLGVPLISNTLPSLIGVECEIEFISSWLTDGLCCHTADILTVADISGIGKTSLVRFVFGLHSSKFQKSCFIEGIDARCNERLNGLLKLQKQLHGGISKKMKIRVHDVNEYSSKIQDVLACKKVFIVLDDIGSINQLDALLGNKGLHPGSKVIVTTKDASLTERCALFNPQFQPKHTKVSHNSLCNTDSLELLCVQAFKCRRPEQGYEEVSKTLVKYCHGHPLAIEVLGKFLHKQDLAYWQEFIEVLQKEHHPDIKKALKTSFDALLFQNDKELFKHIACFFVGVDRDLIETILVACGIKTKIGIKNLVEKGLLSIESDYKLVMHTLIQEIGRDLVFQESPMKPWKRSRLWCSEESFKVLKQKKGKECILGLALDTRMLDKKKSCDELKTKSFSQMDNLMLLQLNYVQLNGCFKKFPEELRWLCMHGSPLKSIPLDFPMDNLVALDMSYSHIESFDMSFSNPQPPAKRQKVQ
uniref:disease resistance protein RUN1-like n=1 Tax=Erigeron canadensis TaxID=72917 RepID=UPI001CB9AFEA|nr:disease resistance protein RUN1-like [Erigeron canadensis]